MIGLTVGSTADKIKMSLGFSKFSYKLGIFRIHELMNLIGTPLN